MNVFTHTVPYFFALAVIAGCATTQFTEQTPTVNETVPRPNQIWVYNFVADPGEIPAHSGIKGVVSPPTTPPTAEQLETGHQLGALIAEDLTADIAAMGLSAVQADRNSTPVAGDGVIRGYLVSAEGGGAAKRFVIGFGYGSSTLDSVVEEYVMTPQSLRSLGSGTVRSSGAKTPGIVVPAAMAIATGNPIGLIVGGGTKIYREASGKNTLEARAKETADEIAAQLKLRFQERGWITAQPTEEAELTWKSVGSGVGAATSNVFYVPAKLIYGTLGVIAGGADYALTGGDQQVANTIWRSSLGGDYVITPDMISGQAPVHFTGPTSTAAVPKTGPSSITNGGAPEWNATSVH